MTDFMHQLIFNDIDKYKIENFDTVSEQALLKQKYDTIMERNVDISNAIIGINNNTTFGNRVNEYTKEDLAFGNLIGKVFFFIYAFLYLLLVISVVFHREELGYVKLVGILIIFAALPFIIDYLSLYFYQMFRNIAQTFYKGNAIYMYNPKKHMDTL